MYVLRFGSKYILLYRACHILLTQRLYPRQTEEAELNAHPESEWGEKTACPSTLAIFEY
jgi:hypothetical protein